MHDALGVLCVRKVVEHTKGHDPVRRMQVPERLPQRLMHARNVYDVIEARDQSQAGGIQPRPRWIDQHELEVEGPKHGRGFAVALKHGLGELHAIHLHDAYVLHAVIAKVRVGDVDQPGTQLHAAYAPKVTGERHRVCVIARQ